MSSALGKVIHDTKTDAVGQVPTAFHPRMYFFIPGRNRIGASQSPSSSLASAVTQGVIRQRTGPVDPRIPGHGLPCALYRVRLRSGGLNMANAWWPDPGLEINWREAQGTNTTKKTTEF